MSEPRKYEVTDFDEKEFDEFIGIISKPQYPATFWVTKDTDKLKAGTYRVLSEDEIMYKPEIDFD